jgi:hypothetical protein
MTTMPARYREGRRAAITSGTWHPRVDGTAAREHLRLLRAAGATYKEIGAAAGISPPTVALAEDTTGQLRTTTAAAILSVRRDDLDPARPNAQGSRFRLQALAAMGHGPVRIGRAVGQDPVYVRKVMAGEIPAVSREFRRSVERVFSAWWDKTPPARDGNERRAVTRARSRARENGWVTGANLDAGLIDVPGYRPGGRYREAWGTGTAASGPAAGRSVREPRPAAPTRRGAHLIPGHG